MRLKTAKQTKTMGYVILGLAALSYILAIVSVILYQSKEIGTTLMCIVTGALWTFCGIMIMKSATSQLEEEENKRVNAFNYGKKKRLHKKIKK